MFPSKPKARSKRTDTPLAAGMKGFLGAGSEFEGRMTFTENMRIDGTFRGEIASQDLLVIGETGQLHAEVSVGSIIISGTFQGTIRAKSSVQLKAPANVKAEINCPRVSMDDGVVFDGSIQMSKQSLSKEHSSQLRATKTIKRPVTVVKSSFELSDEQGGHRALDRLL